MFEGKKLGIFEGDHIHIDSEFKKMIVLQAFQCIMKKNIKNFNKNVGREKSLNFVSRILRIRTFELINIFNQVIILFLNLLIKLSKISI